MSHQALLEILQAGIHSVQPSKIFPRLFTPPHHPILQDWLNHDRRALFCVGKAAVTCAQSVLASCPGGNVFVLAPSGVDAGTLHVHYGSHPVPDEHSYQSTRQLLNWVDSLPAGSALLAVISGGSSALLAAPAAGVSVESKSMLNRLLLSCGATIHEINAVRKHGSAVKGGQLGIRVSKLDCGVLLISDVIGNDPAVIGSGPMYPDPTTFADASVVLQKYGIWTDAPDDVKRRLMQGERGEIPETPKPGSLHIPHEIVASNDIARQAAAEAAKQLGYATTMIREPISGFVEDAADAIFNRIQQAPPGVIIFGGEVTVQLRGGGTGGRNQHLALLMSQKIAGSRVTFLAAGTDGIDGNSRAAGAWTDGNTLQQAKASGLDIDSAIVNFDSFPFFDKLGQSIGLGPTGTNVMDLYIALIQ